MDGFKRIADQFSRKNSASSLKPLSKSNAYHENMVDFQQIRQTVHSISSTDSPKKNSWLEKAHSVKNLRNSHLEMPENEYGDYKNPSSTTFEVNMFRSAFETVDSSKIHNEIRLNFESKKTEKSRNCSSDRR